MSNLETGFEARLRHEHNHTLLGNLAMLGAVIEKRSLTERDEFIQLARAFQVQLSGVAVPGVRIDRSSQLLSGLYDTSIDDLITFSEGKTVADVGAGQSPFLAAFRGHAHTIAIDLKTAHVAYQAEQGHTAIQAAAHDLSAVPSGSVRLLHASYSAPFWSASMQEAAGMAHEYMRVLEEGGIALVGPIIAPDNHTHSEYVIAMEQIGGNPVMPWVDADTAHNCKTLAKFCNTVLGLQAQGGLSSGYADVVGVRQPLDRSIDMANDYPSVQVPNFLMIRRS